MTDLHPQILHPLDLHASFIQDSTNGSLVIDDIVSGGHRRHLPPISLPGFNNTTPFFSLSTIQTITQGAYPYTEDLLALESTSKMGAYPRPQVADITNIRTPLSPTRWSEALADKSSVNTCHAASEGALGLAGIPTNCSTQQIETCSQCLTEYLQNESQERYRSIREGPSTHSPRQQIWSDTQIPSAGKMAFNSRPIIENVPADALSE